MERCLCPSGWVYVYVRQAHMRWSWHVMVRQTTVSSVSRPMLALRRVEWRVDGYFVGTSHNQTGGDYPNPARSVGTKPLSPNGYLHAQAQPTPRVGSRDSEPSRSRTATSGATCRALQDLCVVADASKKPCPGLLRILTRFFDS